MKWNWQQPDWPDFSYSLENLRSSEQRFLLQAGDFIGAYRHIDPEERETLRIELITDEAVKTSEIEGEILNRESVQSSLRQQFGLIAESSKVNPAERGIAEMMIDLYHNFAAPLRHATMHDWHAMLMRGNRSIKVIGRYRTSTQPMQVVSGPITKPKVHFEAPPSAHVTAEMKRFVVWFNATAPNGETPLPALARAALAHLHFVCIHPFEDGNGRIGRALAEKALAQNLGQPTLIALSSTIERKRKAYYAALECNNADLDIDDWARYFADTILEAQTNTIARVTFLIAKARFYEAHRDRLNDRQAKVIARMFRAGIDGFAGGLSAENYIRISKTSRSTATRDLQELVEIGALGRRGEFRHTRYQLRLPGM